MGATSIATAQEIYSMRFLKALTRALAAIKLFSTSFTDEAKEVGETVKVPLISPDAVAAWDATTNNFVRAATEIKEVKVSLNSRIIAGFGITSEQMNNFRPNWWEGKAGLNVQTVADTIVTAMAALVTKDNFGDTAADKASVVLAGFDRKAVAAIRALAVKRNMRPNRSVLVLNPDFYSALLGVLPSNEYGGREAILNGVIPGLLGFSAVAEMPQYSGPGFVCHADALAVATRRIALPDGTPYKLVSDLTEPETGLTMTQVIYTHGETGSLNNSINASYGVAVGNENSLLRLVA